MIKLRLPSDHPNSPVLQKWATEKESLIGDHAKQINQLQGLLKTILTNNPELGKPK